MIQNLNPVKPKIRLNGEELSFESMVLEQQMSDCQRFEIVKEFMSQDELWQVSPFDCVAQIGAEVLIRFEHWGYGASYEFAGVVTDVKLEAWESEKAAATNHRSNRLRIIGAGIIVKLDGAKGRDSFADCQLQDVVCQLTEKLGVNVLCTPRYEGVLPFLMRYDESVFAFLNRLASIFGEPFYYDGKDLHFGFPDASQVETLMFDGDIVSLRTSVKTLPRKGAFYDYYFEDDKFYYSEGKASSSSSVLQDMVKKSDMIFDETGSIPSMASLSDSETLTDFVDGRQLALEGGMFTIEGETRTCRVRLGEIIEVAFPPRMMAPALGRFRVISLVHRIDKNGNYTNHFVATPEGTEQVPLHYVQAVKAYPEIAIVADNQDPMGLGRVRVQFDWQRPKWQSTNWIRIITPNGGEDRSHAKGRGFLFVPEVGDQVMVGFEHGDPNRPYVIGSMFSGSTAMGGGYRNKVKSISTRSGHRIVFNDDEESGMSITISDKSGNVILLDTEGQHISLSSLSSISLLSDSINIDASNKVSINAGSSLQVTSKKAELIIGDETSILAKTFKVDVAEKEIHQSDAYQVNANTEINLASKKVVLDSQEENLVLGTGSDIEVQSKGKVNLF